MTLDASAARRVFKVLAYLAGGEAGPDEKAFLSAFCTEHGVSDAERPGLYVAAQDRAVLEAPQGQDEQATLIGAMIELVAADGVLDHHEQDRLMTLAADLQIPQGVMKAQLLERLMGG